MDGSSQTTQTDKPKGGRGGARPGAGRKAKWGQKTVVMRVPEGLRAEVEEFIRLRSEGVVLVREDEIANLAEPVPRVPDQPKPKKRSSKPKASKVAAPEQESLFDLSLFL